MRSNKELITQKDPKSPVSEVFRTLRTNIQFMNANKKLKTLLITSTFPGEGKSWVASNLAVTFAQAENKVILIDADMRKGRQYTIFDALPKPGLSNYLSGMDLEDGEKPDISNYLQRTDIDNLLLMTAGNIPPNPSELLVSTQMTDLLEKLKDVCDIIIIDGTPCELVTDSVIISRVVDSTVIVTAHKETKKDNLEKIIRNIKNVGGNLAGVVINKMPVSIKKFNENYYYASTTGEDNIDMKAKKSINIERVSKNNPKTEESEDTKNDKNSKHVKTKKEPEIEEKTSKKTKEEKTDKENIKKENKKESSKTNKENNKNETAETKKEHKEKEGTEIKEEHKEINEKIMEERTKDILEQINSYLEKEKSEPTNKEKDNQN